MILAYILWKLSHVQLNARSSHILVGKKRCASFVGFICQKLFSANPNEIQNSCSLFTSTGFQSNGSAFFIVRRVLNRKYERNFSVHHSFVTNIIIFTWVGSAGNAPKLLWTTYYFVCHSHTALVRLLATVAFSLSPFGVLYTSPFIGYMQLVPFLLWIQAHILCGFQ